VLSAPTSSSMNTMSEQLTATRSTLISESNPGRKTATAMTWNCFLMTVDDSRPVVDKHCVFFTKCLSVPSSPLMLLCSVTCTQLSTVKGSHVDIRRSSRDALRQTSSHTAKLHAIQYKNNVT